MKQEQLLRAWGKFVGICGFFRIPQGSSCPLKSPGEKPQQTSQHMPHTLGQPLPKCALGNSTLPTASLIPTPHPLQPSCPLHLPLPPITNNDSVWNTSDLLNFTALPCICMIPLGMLEATTSPKVEKLVWLRTHYMSRKTCHHRFTRQHPTGLMCLGTYFGKSGPRILPAFWQL